MAVIDRSVLTGGGASDAYCVTVSVDVGGLSVGRLLSVNQCTAAVAKFRSVAVGGPSSVKHWAGGVGHQASGNAAPAQRVTFAGRHAAKKYPKVHK